MIVEFSDLNGTGEESFGVDFEEILKPPKRCASSIKRSLPKLLEMGNKPLLPIARDLGAGQENYGGIVFGDSSLCVEGEFWRINRFRCNVFGSIAKITYQRMYFRTTPLNMPRRVRLEQAPRTAPGAPPRAALGAAPTACARHVFLPQFE